MRSNTNVLNSQPLMMSASRETTKVPLLWVQEPGLTKSPPVTAAPVKARSEESAVRVLNKPDIVICVTHALNIGPSAWMSTVMALSAQGSVELDEIAVLAVKPTARIYKGYASFPCHAHTLLISNHFLKVASMTNHVHIDSGSLEGYTTSPF